MPEIEECALGVENKTKIRNLERIVIELKNDIREIKDKLLRRPSWFVTILISTMAMLIVYLMMELIKGK